MVTLFPSPRVDAARRAHVPKPSTRPNLRGAHTRGEHDSYRLDDGLTSAAVGEQRRGIVMAIAGLVVLAANVIDAADRGSPAWNVVAIVAGVFLLFYGFTLVGRSSRPGSGA